MYPFFNPYSAILARQREEEERRQREEAAHRRRRFLVPGTWGGEEIPDDTARLARGRGLLAFGTSLLGLEAAKDPGAALGRGVSGFTDAMSGTLEEQRQIARQREADEREREQEKDRQRQADLTFESGAAELEEFRDKQRRGREIRVLTGKSAGDMVREIEEVSGAESPEAGQARALAGLGEEADLNRLAELHDAATKRSRRGEDAAFQTEQEIRDAQAKVRAGVVEDPLAAGRRAERGLALEAQRNAAYLESIRERGTGRAPTAAQFEDDVRAEAKTIYDRRVDALEAAARGRVQKPVQGPDGSYSIPPAFTQADLDRIANEARTEAERVVQRRYQQGGAPSGPAASAATPDEIERRLGRGLTPDERAEVEAAIRMGYSIDRILGAL